MRHSLREEALQSVKNSLRNAWIASFDPSTEKKYKEALLWALKECERNPSPYHNVSILEEEMYYSREKFVGNLPSSTSELIIASVMTGGYDYGAAVSRTLQRYGVSTNFVTIGYSTGKHEKRKEFADGTKLSRKLFVPEGDLEILFGCSTSIVLADHVIETGLTNAVIGRALLYQMQFNGQIYQFTDAAQGSGKYPEKTIHLWDGGLDRTIISERTVVDDYLPVEIFTELGRKF